MIDSKLIYRISFVLLIALLCFQCTSVKNDERQYSHMVKQLHGSHEINAEWDKEIWVNTRSLRLNNFMGDKPSHFPETKVKLRYDKDNIYVIFKVMDNYIKAVAKKMNDKVWLDSCVEFFFSPGPDVERGYFNFEANCKGIFLFKYNINDGKTIGYVSMDD